ncbi:hypothetical protein DCO49_00220 [Stenotrophomonas sp. SPM]|uniref:sigma-70 family RNA polymerase sigma factor n=1 Tax=Stenotrophomonas sp. SPM TaxID=2170735 RepID=UPI000DE769F4|nr:sigma-70 family RNA polymerase sigma factor [Stenotrophomonas sp. SPM]PWB29829.1 hypothetical protein DCO49_00220 [Stenotrophomonas sp. SPM]
MAIDHVELDLWRAQQQGDKLAKASLVGRYLPWSEALADRIHRRVFSLGIPREDLRQSASLGLLEAMSRFNPERGIPFAGYAIARVRGAVFNAVRESTRHPSGAEATERTHERLHSVRTRAMDDSDSLFDQVVDDIVALGMGFLLDIEAAQLQAQPCTVQEYAERSLMSRRLRQAMLQLPERSRLLIEAHYFEHLPFKTLVERLGVSKGRVSQLHHRALSDLRAALSTQAITRSEGQGPSLLRSTPGPAAAA